MTKIEKLLVELLEIPSVSGNEAAVGDFIAQHCKSVGVVAHKQHVADNRFNVVAKKGDGDVWLVAHMDTVPGVVPIKVTDDAVYGRGACDNKQSVAAALILLERMDTLNVLFTVGEEDDLIGARTAHREGIAGSFVVVLEPSRYEIKTGNRGVLAFTIAAHGTSQHSSLDDPDSATLKLVTVLTALEKKNYTAYNIGTIAGGAADNVVAEYAHASVSVRPETDAEYEDIIETLKSMQTDDITVEIKINAKPVKSDLGFPQNIAKGFSEMAYFANSIEYGAGNIAYAHTDHEHITRKDLNTFPDKLEALLASHSEK